MKNNSMFELTANQCARYCQGIIEQIEKAKELVLNEFRARAAGHEERLQAAISEAETLARLTRFPHLTFLDLAQEKVLSALGSFTPEDYTPTRLGLQT